MDNGTDQLAKQLKDSSKDAVERLRIALGVKDKSEIMALLKKDPEARKFAARILGSSSPHVVKSALGVKDDKTTHPLSNGGNGQKAKIKF